MKILPLRAPPCTVKSEAVRRILVHMAVVLKPGRDAGPHHGLALVQSAKGKRRPKSAEGSGGADDCAGDGPS